MGKKSQQDQTLESIVNGGLFGGRRKKTVGGQLLNSLGVESVLYDSTRSSDYFGMEANRLLGEANQLGTFADTVLESMKNGIRLAADMKKKYSIENLDPVAFALENEATGASKAGFFKKVWDTLVAVFQRIVLAVANFVKQIQVWVSGPIAKAQADFYTKNKAAIEAGLKGEQGKQKIVALKPIASPSAVLQAVVKAGEAAGLGADALGAKLAVLLSSKNIAKDVEDNKALSQELFTKVTAAASGITKGSKTLPGRESAQKAVFGDAKPASIEIAQLFKAEDFAGLGQKGFHDIVSLVNEGKKAAATVAKVSAKIRQISQAVQKSAATDEGVTNAQAVTTAANDVKRFQSVQINMLFGAFSVYMRYRGYLYAAAKVLAKGAAKAAPEAAPAAAEAK